MVIRKENYNLFNEDYEALCMPALYKQNNVEFDFCFMTPNISENSSIRIMIDTDNETVNTSSYSGLIVRTDLYELFSYDTLGDGTYYYNKIH